MIGDRMYVTCGSGGTDLSYNDVFCLSTGQSYHSGQCVKPFKTGGGAIKTVYSICGAFGEDFNLAVWEIYLKLPI